MIATLKAELKKLLTVRSTYFVLGMALSLSALFTYLGTSQLVYKEEVRPADASEQKSTEPKDGPRGEIVTKIDKNLPKEKVVSNLQDQMTMVSIFIAVVVVLVMAHEFRHNTITYTLTASNSRSKVLASKVVVGIAFVVTASLLAMGVIVATTYIAIGIKGLSLPPQDFNWLYVTGRLVGYSLGFSLLALALMTIIRNITGGIVALFLLPVIDDLIGALLSSRNIEPTKFLPLSALNRVLNLMVDYLPLEAFQSADSEPIVKPASLLRAVTVFLIYFVVVWGITWYLFLRRDATN